MPTYGAAALQTFAHGVAGLTGNSVEVRVAGRRAYTDGRLVVLPADGAWEENDFRALCGTACHELAHVWFKSTDRLPGLTTGLNPEAAARTRLAFNAVADVADETRFAHALPEAEKLFAAAREQIVRDAAARGSLPQAPPAGADEDRLVAAAILWARSPVGSATRKRLRGWYRGVPGLADLAKLLGRAREPKPRGTGTFRPGRTVRQWQRLESIAARAASLLDQLFPPRQPPGGSPAAAGADDPLRVWASAAVDEAVARSAAGAAVRLPDKVDWTDAIARWADGSILTGGAPVAFLWEHYDRVLPAFRSAARGLAVAPELTREGGFLSGGSLSRPHRAAVDGRCFRRGNWEEGVGASVAVLFDQSDSMAGSLRVFLPVGAALVDALRAAGAEVGVWRYGSRVEPVARTADLAVGRTMGSTATDAALREAGAWLGRRDGRCRAVVVFTDGRPNRLAETSAEAVRLRRAGVALMVGAMGLSELECGRSIPGCVVFDVDPRNAAHSLHVAIGRLARLF